MQVYSAEMKAKAVRLVREHAQDYPSHGRDQRAALMRGEIRLLEERLDCSFFADGHSRGWSP